jgi:hypothetical protein
MTCGSKNGVVVAVATLGLPLTARTSPMPRPGVQALGIGHGEHLADGVAFADGDAADHLAAGVTSS